MKPRELEIGDVVQLGPNVANPMFAYCMMVVTEPKKWGAQGFVQSLGNDGKPGGKAYYRVEFEEMEFIGRAEWIPA